MSLLRRRARGGGGTPELEDLREAIVQMRRVADDLRETHQRLEFHITKLEEDPDGHRD